MVVVGCFMFASTLCVNAQKDKRDYDWANFKRYENANQNVKTPANVVFMGNSITDGWARKHPEFFKDNYFIGRGISGQTTSQMLVRFRRDVLDLEPRAVVILAGTNDIAKNTGIIKFENILGNIISMAELAKAHDIKVIICSILPAYDYWWSKGIEPAEKIIEVNKMIKAYCDENKITYVDFHTAMKDSRNGLP